MDMFTNSLLNFRAVWRWSVTQKSFANLVYFRWNDQAANLVASACGDDVYDCVVQFDNDVHCCCLAALQRIGNASHEVHALLSPHFSSA